MPRMQRFISRNSMADTVTLAGRVDRDELKDDRIGRPISLSRRHSWNRSASPPWRPDAPACPCSPCAARVSPSSSPTAGKVCWPTATARWRRRWSKFPRTFRTTPDDRRAQPDHPATNCLADGPGTRQRRVRQGRGDPCRGGLTGRRLHDARCTTHWGRTMGTRSRIRRAQELSPPVPIAKGLIAVSSARCHRRWGRPQRSGGSDSRRAGRASQVDSAGTLRRSPAVRRSVPAALFPPHRGQVEPVLLSDRAIARRADPAIGHRVSPSPPGRSPPTRRFFGVASAERIAGRARARCCHRGVVP